ncbi:MAG TPA: hypothetical protein VKI44_03210 [Acetobacteraceae bacterium]|nr:hypothetical protein [Acetobacteraceae bacterium]
MGLGDGTAGIAFCYARIGNNEARELDRDIQVFGIRRDALALGLRSALTF